MATSCDILWHLVTSCDILWHLVTSCDILWHLATSCDILWHLVTSYDVLWHMAISCDILWHLVTFTGTNYGIMWHSGMSLLIYCDIMWRLWPRLMSIVTYFVNVWRNKTWRHATVIARDKRLSFATQIDILDLLFRLLLLSQCYLKKLFSFFQLERLIELTSEIWLCSGNTSTSNYFLGLSVFRMSLLPGIKPLTC